LICRTHTVELSPFVVTTDNDVGHAANQSLAGLRLAAERLGGDRHRSARCEKRETSPEPA
jgi:hypothetical protein